MTYSQLFYYCLLWPFLSVSSSICTGINKNLTISTINSVTTRSNHAPHTLHSSAIPPASLLPGDVSHQRHHTSNIQHTKSMNILSPMDITTRAQWHAWFTQRRVKLKHRLEQAEQAEWNWPSTRRRCDIMRIEDEIRRLDAEEFVTPF